MGHPNTHFPSPESSVGCVPPWMGDLWGTSTMDSISVLWAFLPSRKGHVPPLTLREENHKCFKRGGTQPSKKQSHFCCAVPSQLPRREDCYCEHISAQRLHGIISMWAPSVKQGSLLLRCTSSSLLQALAPSGVQLQVPKAPTRAKQDEIPL